MYDLKQRHSKEELKADRLLINSLEFFREVFNSISTVSLVLNESRQIIFASNDFLKLLNLDDAKELLGFRPGESFSCIHSNETAYGCGTSDSCSLCGIYQAISKSEKQRVRVTNEARITTKRGGKRVSWDFSTTSVPITIADRNYYIVTIIDISSEKRKKQLERIFLHDLANSAGGIQGLSNILKDEGDEDMQREMVEMLSKSSNNIMDQIMSYRHIICAEAGDLEVNRENVNTLDLVHECVDSISNSTSWNSAIRVDPSSEYCELFTDKTLVSRVVTNMLKNAVEAENSENSEVFIGVNKSDNKIKIWVKNNTVMPKHIQRQIFQRSFSTKNENFHVN